jgi:hypothetical protein
MTQFARVIGRDGMRGPGYFLLGLFFVISWRGDPCLSVV